MKIKPTLYWLFLKQFLLFQLKCVFGCTTTPNSYAAGIRLWTGRGSGASFFNDRCVLDWW